MATKQDLKAKALKDLEEEQRRLAEAEAKKRAAAEKKAAQQEAKKKAETAARKEADLPGYKAKTDNKSYAAGTKQGLNDSMAQRLNAGRGQQIIENRKTEKTAQQETKRRAEAAARKEADLPGYKPRATISKEDMFRLLGLDTKAAENELARKKAEYSAEGGGTLGAVRSGMKVGNPNKTVLRDYEGLKAKEEDIANRERDIILSNQLKKEAEYAGIANDPAKMAFGLAGYEKYSDFKEKTEKAQQEERAKQGAFEQAVFAGFNSPDNTLPTAGFQQAVNAHREDTSEVEPNEQWSDEQKRIFGYYIYTGELNKAREYALSVNNAIRAGEKQEALKETTKFGMNNKFLADVASVPGSMLRGAGFLDDLAQYAAQGYISENSMPLPGEMIDAYRGTRGQMLNIEHGTLGENAGILEGKGLGDLYQVGMSTADSLFAAYTGGKPGALISAFGSSATAAVDDALARGATAEQAIGYGALSGAAELFPEYMSVDSLLKILPSGGAKMLANIGRQGLTEGAEGLITSLSSALADEAVMGELSKYNVEVNNLMLSGLSREEAEKIAQNSVNEEIILDTIGEAIGGLGSGGFAATIQNFTAGKKNTPVPFEGKAEPGTEAAMVADKIAEIENRPNSEADKAEAIEKVMKAVEEAGTEEGLYKEAAKSAEYHKKKAADLEEAASIGKKLGIAVEFDENLAANGVHTADGRIIINPNTENPVLQVLVHELTHEIESSGFYGQLSENILGYVEGMGISLDSMRQMVQADYAEAGIKLSPNQTDSEIVAKFAERYLFTDEKAIERLCDTSPSLFRKIRYWISDMVIKLRGTAEEKFILDAQQLYERAWATRGERTGAGTEQFSYDYSKPFEQQIDDWKKGLVPQKDTLIVGATPKVFQDIGFNALPMTIDQTHIDYAINNTKNADHFYGEIDLKKLPKAINDPVAIISSKTQGKTSAVALIKLPVNGKESVVPVVVDGFGRMNNIQIDSNAITSVHGRSGTANLLVDAINKEAAGQISIFYINKKEAQSLLNRAGSQLPGALIPRDGFVHSIRENGSSVKPKLDNVTESLQFKRWFGDWQKHPKNASKVVNPDGTPKVVYHGTRNADFSVFNRNWNFFTDNKEMADSYSPNGDMYEVYLDIKKPFVIDAYGEKWSRIPISDDLKEILDNYGASTFEEDGEWRTTPADIASAILDGIDEGEFDYDGIIIENVDDTGGYYKNSESNIGTDYIVFDSRKVKSATDNIGTFDPQNPDIRYSSGRGFDELARESKEKTGEKEILSAEISDSAKRVLEQMQRKPKVQQSTQQAKPEEPGGLVDIPQSEKSKRIERRYQRAVEEGVASVFGISRSDLKGNIRPIIEEISSDIKNGKKISDEQIEKIYKTAFEDGIITEEFPQYEQTRRYIRTTPIYVDEKTRHEFGEDYEFRDFARSNFGSMKISSDPKSSHLDSFYMSLADLAPDFFNEFETDPRTQLEEIADFMQRTKKQYYGLSEVYSGENLAEFEKWAKTELKNYMDEFGKGLDNIQRYERDRQIKATNKAREIDRTASFDEAKAAFDGNKIFEARKAMEKAKAGEALNDDDLDTVKRLLSGTMTEADVRFKGAGNVEGIIKVYEAEKAYREARAPFDRYRKAYKTAVQHDAIEATKYSDEWTDKNIGFEYSRETAERNIRDITKNGKNGGNEVIAEYIAPIHEHEAQKNRWIREMNQRVKELELGRMNKYERAYAQMIGENASYITEGRITKHDQFEHEALNERIQALLNEHGKRIDKAKCEKAAAGLMDIYSDILEQWNDERIRRGQEPVGRIENYFPHFTEAKPLNTIQKIFALFGFDVGSSKLPTDIAGRTADRKPNSKYNPYANRRTTDITDYDVLKGFDNYVRAVGDNIYHTEDIQKLRALSDAIRTKYSSEELEKRIEEIQSRENLTEEDKDVLIADALKAAPGAYHLSNLVVWLDEYTNILAGKKSRGDREAEYQMGREIYDITKALEGRIASNMIGYNLSTPIMNLVPLFQSAADLNPVEILSSILQTGVAAARGNSFISDNSDFITNRFGADSVYKDNYSIFSSESMKDFVSKISDGGSLLMELVDRVVSESLVRARYTQNIKKGLDTDSAFAEADEWAAGLIADRSLGALPTVFNVKNPVAKALTMFQVEANNQYSYIFKDAGKYKLDKEGALKTITGQLAFWTAMAICNGLAKELLGRDNVVPDPVGLSAKSIGKIIKGEPVGNVALDAATTAVEQIPFVGGLLGGGRIPISSAIPDIEQTAKLFNREVAPEKKKQILIDEILKPFSYIFMPSGAGQFIWKTGKGIEQIKEGGAFGMENDGSKYMKFPQKYDVDSVVKTLLFGQYASDAGQRYIDSGFTDKLSVKQTEQMKLAEKYGISKEDFYETVLGLKPYGKKEEKQEALLENEKLPVDVKEKFDYILFGKPTYKQAEEGTAFPERDYRGREEFYKSGLSDTQRRLDEDGYSYGEIKKIEGAIKEGQSKAEDIAAIAKVLDISEREAFEVYQKRSGNWISDEKALSSEERDRAQKAAEYYGMSTDQYIAVLNYSKAENAKKDIAAAFDITEENAEGLLDLVTRYEYSKDDLDEEKIFDLDTSGAWYEIEEEGYFISRNAIKSAKGKKDKFGNTISGSKKAEAIEEIARQLDIDEEEATLYYLAANGDLALSVKDLSSAKQSDFAEAKKHGWTERQFLDAVNVIKLSGAKKKDDIISALMDIGAPYEMAVGYYNLSENYDYFKRS